MCVWGGGSSGKGRILEEEGISHARFLEWITWDSSVRNPLSII